MINSSLNGKSVLKKIKLLTWRLSILRSTVKLERTQSELKLKRRRLQPSLERSSQKLKTRLLSTKTLRAENGLDRLSSPRRRERQESWPRFKKLCPRNEQALE